MIPSEQELIKFLKRNELVNFSTIARHFDIQNATVSDIVFALERKKVLEVKKIGGSKIVRLRAK